MERRQGPRFDAAEPVTVHVLGESREEIAGSLENLSGKGARLVLDEPVAVDAAIEIDLGDRLFLGEVCYSEPVPGGYAIGVHLNQVLHETPDLAALLRALTGGQHAGDRATAETAEQGPKR